MRRRASALGVHAVVIAGSLLASGCGDNRGPQTAAFEARSGSRIKVRWYVYDDGARQWDPQVFYDGERDERCSVSRWSDGNQYCTPNAVSTVFTDATCETGEVGRWLATQPPPTYFFREFTLIGDEVISRLFHRGDVVPVPVTTYELTGGRCVETPGSGWIYYALAGELRSENFVQVRQRDTIDANRLARHTYTTDDGFEMPLGFEQPRLFDREIDGDCVVAERPNSTTTTCEPHLTGEALYSRDPQCAPTDVIVVEPNDPVPEVVIDEVAGCKTYAWRGAQLESVPLFLPLGPSCVSVALSPDAHRFEVGDPFDAPAFTRLHEPTAHRLQRILLTSGTLTAIDTLLFDRELGVDCTRTFITTAGGGNEYRCLPANTFAYVLPYFSDPQCLEPVEISFVESGACDPPTRFAIDTRGEEPAVRPLLAPFVNTLYEISTADTCLAYVPPPRVVPFTVGAALPPETFVSARLVIE